MAAICGLCWWVLPRVAFAREIVERLLSRDHIASPPSGTPSGRVRGLTRRARALIPCSWFNQALTDIHRARGLTKHHLTTLKLCSLQDPKNTENIEVTPTCHTLHFTSVSSTSVAIAAILHRDVLEYKTDFGTCFPLYLRAFLT